MVGSSIATVVLVAAGYSAWIEHIAVDYTIVVVPGYTVVVPPFAAKV